MDIEKLKNIWDNYDEKLDETLQINRELLKKIKTEKVRSKLKKYAIYRIAEAVFTIWFISFLSDFILDHSTEIQFIIPALILGIFFVVMTAGNVKQLVIIYTIDYSEPVTEIQKKLISIETHVLRFTGIIVLSVPFYMAYVVIGFEELFGFDIVTYGTGSWWWGQIIFSIMLIPVCIWLFKKITDMNSRTSFFRKFSPKSGLAQIRSSILLMDEIEEFERN